MSLMLHLLVQLPTEASRSHASTQTRQLQQAPDGSELWPKVAGEMALSAWRRTGEARVGLSPTQLRGGSSAFRGTQSLAVVPRKC